MFPVVILVLTVIGEGRGFYQKILETVYTFFTTLRNKKKSTFQ